MIRELTVLYDGRCGLCRGARRWLAEQPSFVRLELLAAGSAEARRRFPELDHEATRSELTVVDDRGGVYLGARAWLTCLWALEAYRGAAERLATPKLLPYARAFFETVSRHRLLFGERCEAAGPETDGGLEPSAARR